MTQLDDLLYGAQREPVKFRLIGNEQFLTPEWAQWNRAKKKKSCLQLFIAFTYY